MSGGIEEPYSIASLPKPLDAEHGRIVGANVYSLSGAKKRKRHEVAVGVDGESVNIYNTQNQTTASSYALPPQSYLAAPPCSIYCRRAKPLQPQRQTYIAVRDGANGQKARLVSISEDLGKPQSEEREPRAPSRRERKLRQGKIAALDVIAGEPSGDRSVLVSYTNGNVDCISGDLSGTRWEHTRSGESDLEVEFAALVDFETARKGLLKNREDVLAVLDTTSQASSESSPLPLLVQVTCSESQRSLAIYAVRNAHGQTLQTHRPALEEVLSYDIPFRHRHGSAQYELHAASGLLYQRLGSRLNIADLSGTTPKLCFELGRKGNPIVDSFTRLSVATVLVVSPGRIGVYDIKYGSLLSSLDYPSTSKLLTGTGNETSASSQTQLSIISQFSDLSIVVGLSGTSLVAWQVGDMLDDGRRAKAHGPLLLEVMDKGKVVHETFGISAKQEKKRKRWEEWIAKVDGFISEADIEALEDFIAQDLFVNNVMDTQGPANGEANGHVNGHPQPERSEWDLPSTTFDPQYVNSAKARHLLSQAFRWRRNGTQRDQPDCHLEVALFSRNILRWLALAGYLTESEIQLALAGSMQGVQPQPRVALGDVMAAIGDAEHSLRLMYDMVRLPVHWPVDDVVRGVQILVRLLNNQDTYSATNDPVKALTNGDVAMKDGDVDSELAAAVRQLDEAQAIMESGLAFRNEVCHLLLVRLQSFPHKDVVRAMHRMMTDEDIMQFILVLRNELVMGGWTQKYVEQGSSEEDLAAGLGNAQEIEPSNQAIRTIANLCSCAVDAVGLSGWLVGRAADRGDTLEFIDRLRNEISAALEGLFQAEKLDTILAELKRAAGAAQQKASLKRKRKDEEEESMTEEQKLMPLGGRGEPPVIKDWYTKTGIKSKAAIAQQKNRNVGKYSFERIRI